MKSYWTSKTLWVNVLAIAAIIAQGQFGYKISPETQVSILALVNLVLRAITKEAIVWGKVEK